MFASKYEKFSAKSLFVWLLITFEEPNDSSNQKHKHPRFSKTNLGYILKLWCLLFVRNYVVLKMMDKRLNDDILRAIKTGDNAYVLNHLYKFALPKITSLIVRNNGDIEEAKDVFQDAVMALFNTVKLGKYDPDKDILGFLFFVSKNLWINRVRKKNKQSQFVDTEGYTDHQTPLVTMLGNEKQTAIVQLMAKLGDNCKEILKYVFYDKLSMKEIVVKMGLANEDVAKTTNYRCKKKLAQLIYADKSALRLFKD